MRITTALRLALDALSRLAQEIPSQYSIQVVLQGDVALEV
jgi:hypothetical protein